MSQVYEVKAKAKEQLANSIRRHIMTKNRMRSIGILMILIFVTGIFSIVYVLESPDYLVQLPTHLNEIYVGGGFQLAMVAIYMALIVLITPLIRDYGENLSKYFIASRSISIAFHIIGIILLMLFVPLSHANVISSKGAYQVIGDILRLGRDLTNHIGVIIPYLIGSLIFYFVLLKENYTYKWLILLGYFGISLALVSSILILFNIISIVSPIFIILSLPLAVQELLLAIVLIFRRVNVSTNL